MSSTGSSEMLSFGQDFDIGAVLPVLRAGYVTSSATWVDGSWT
jgi:hypothetical protein